MPIMPNTDVYMPDPLTGPRAATAGFAIGKESSPFANFVQGAFQGAKDTVQIADTLQQMEFRPIDAARQDKEQQAMEAYRIRNNEQQDERLAFDKMKQQQDYDLAKQQEARLRMGASIAQGNQARGAMATGAAAEFIVGDNPAPIEAIFAGNDRALKGKLLEEINKDPDLMSQMQYRANELVLQGKASPAMEQFNEALQHSATLAKAANDAKDAESIIRNEVGFSPDPRHLIHVEPSKDANGGFIENQKTVYQYKPGETTKTRMGTISTTGDPKEENKFEKAKNAHNNLLNQQLKSEEKIRQNAINKVAEGQQGAPPPQDEVPVNISRATTKIGPEKNKYAEGRRANLSNVQQVTTPKIEQEIKKQKDAANDSKRAASKEKLMNVAKPSTLPGPGSPLLYGRPYGTR